MGQRGRTCKLTPELRAEIVKRVLAGNYPTVAAQSAGISQSSFCAWMAKGLKKGLVPPLLSSVCEDRQDDSLENAPIAPEIQGENTSIIWLEKVQQVDSAASFPDVKNSSESVSRGAVRSLEERLGAAFAAKDWSLMAELSARLSRKECSARGSGWIIVSYCEIRVFNYPRQDSNLRPSV